MRWFDWLSARYTAGTRSNSQTANTAQRNLRRFRWAVFAVWLLLLVPAVYLALNQSNHLTGGGFEVAGSQ
ncbi:hypothetical protein C6A85_08200, partial [Mycobacterium sp. ITM-2017-0098]